MRSLALSAILAATGLAGCSAQMAQPNLPSQRAQADLHRALDGKVAGKPVDCLPSFRSGDMQVIDDNTILFHEGRRTYVQAPRGGCSPIGSGHYTLVTRSFGGGGLCRGDIARVVDLQNGFTVGSCGLESFVPYDPPRRG